jgi:UDP-2,3-diacylglucosamine pyrophosphatase LpxH
MAARVELRSWGSMAGVKRLIIADAHVGQRRGDSSAMAAMLREARRRGVTEVIYLGDAFQYLIGMSKFWTAGMLEVMASWRELRGDGVRVVVVEGNRDFFLDAGDLAREIDWSGRCYEFASGGIRFRLVHGDKVNLRDLQYRFWSRLSKSSPARLWARLLPRGLAVSIVRTMEARLAETNRKFRYRRPFDSLRAVARQAWDEGVDVLLWGHFHEAWVYRHDHRMAMILPAWLDTRLAVVVDSDGGWCVVQENLTPGRGLSKIA